MSIRAGLAALAKRVGYVVGHTETCETCGQLAPAGTSAADEDGPASDVHGVPRCARCRMPVAAEGLIVSRWARGFLAHAKVIDLR